MSFLGIKTKKPNQYSYTPRYYSQRKEIIEEIKNKHREISDEEYINGFRRNPRILREYSIFERKARRPKQNTTFRLLLIIVVLTIIVYFIIGEFNVMSILS